MKMIQILQDRKDFVILIGEILFILVNKLDYVSASPTKSATVRKR